MEKQRNFQKLPMVERVDPWPAPRRDLDFSYEPQPTDVLTIEGVKYSGLLFRTIAFPAPFQFYQFKRVGEVVLIEEFRAEAVIREMGLVRILAAWLSGESTTAAAP